ncbi:2,3-dihydroxybenzoate-AMP ligase [Ancylobacter novellus DSM 506]|uniref:2,3-dihydroxybenzoate-AMP ligase n=1 Tax=Ancylobacter novellus (strain ATCC 8093 / DSM 506 / JCM 20403 / CCM 1077 / IAM 12100 / NBRC 12443 / NCIMB 10456) TaxID=639283 RepID=D7A8S3_ANCN5|nr:(2,3-dihydroxybenzoyl)adenylate synthase [Ancylobacter novellus]ADH90607.1 2,3-dihydroxybenzoate-AMP ligase [Ancylobacter novellus DSM 506]
MKPLSQVWPDDFAARYRAKGYWRGETFSSFLRARAAELPDHLAVVGGEHRWTFAELEARAENIARGLLVLGLNPGDRVVVQLPNIAEFLSVVFGLFRARLIPVYALPAHRIVEITHFAHTAEARGYLIAASHDGFDYRTLAQEVREQVPAVEHVVVVGEGGPFTALDALPAGREIALPEDADPSEVAFLQISGGSTGLSKLIPRTHDDYIYSFRASAEICKLTPESVYLAALPVAHNFPMSSPGVFGALYAGSRVVLSPSPSPEVAFPLIAREGVTITGLVPPLALLWLQAAPSTAHDLSSLQVLQVGGAKFLTESARRVKPVLGCTLQQVFGMAEGLVNYTRLDDDEESIVSTQGRPISPDDEVLILDDEGNPVPEGEAGNLLTRGPYTIRAYHNDDGANARSFTPDGFYRTGDVVKRTPDGYLVVQGRATDHINRAGEKISAEEIEDHLLAHPGVFDAAVVSLPDEFLGERSCAFVIPQGEKPKAAALKAWMRTRGLADFKVPDQVVFVDAFETTAVGKVSRKELRASLRRRFLEAAEAEK